MPNWGSQTAGSGSSSGNQYYFIGGVSPNEAGMSLDSITVRIGAASTVRLALYQGGAIDDITASGGLTLIEDLGEVTNAGGAMDWVTLNSTTTPTVPQNTRVWIGVKDDSFQKPNSGLIAEDIDSAVRYFGPTRDSATAWEATITSQSAALTAPFIPTYITYTAAPPAGLTITSTPTNVRVTEQRTISISGADTGLVAGNFVIKLDDTNGPAATVDSIVDNGGGAYDINFTFPRETTGLFGVNRPLYIATIT